MLPGELSAQGAGVDLGGLRADPTAPVEVVSDELEIDQDAGSAVFSGGVIVTQGDMRLSAPRIEVEYQTTDGTQGVSRITASGGVVIVTPTEAAEAREAVFEPTENRVVMTGDVLLTQGPNTLNGERLVVDLLTGNGRIEGRVRTILQPGQGQ